MTLDQMMGLGLPIECNEGNLMMVNAGIAWLGENTTLEVTEYDYGKIRSLPSSARLFLCKFCEVYSREAGVASEGVGPMSQAFTTDSVEKQVMALARQLLGLYLKPNVRFIPCTRRWR